MTHNYFPLRGLPGATWPHLPTRLPWICKTICFFALFWWLPRAVHAQERCGTAHQQARLVEQYPGLDSIYRGQERVLTAEGPTNGVLTIPIVFHVVYNTNVQKVSYQALSQAVDVLTRDFRRQNADAANTGQYGGFQSPTGLWSQNYSSIAADCEIAFRFCDVTYDYTPDVAINLIQSPLYLKTLFPYYQQYNPAKYLNVWVCNLSGGLLGLASFPGSPAQQDGVSIAYQSVLPGNADFRVLTHEVGHWLGLRHIWGDCTCCDDYVNDTAPQQGSNQQMVSQPPFPGLPNQAPCAMWTACPGMNVYNNLYYPYVNMGDNYMDYSPSSCLNFFSLGQKQRMWYFLNNSRAALLSNPACGAGTGLEERLAGQALHLYPNPAAQRLTVSGLPIGSLLVVSNVLGAAVLQMDVVDEQMELDVSALPAGLYFVNRTRFVKQ